MDGSGYYSGGCGGGCEGATASEERTIVRLQVGVVGCHHIVSAKPISGRRTCATGSRAW